MFNVGGTTISSRTRMSLVGRRFPQGSCPYVPAGECPGRYHHDRYLYIDARNDLDGLGAEDKASIVAKTVEGKVT